MNNKILNKFKLHHIGYAVQSIDSILKIYTDIMGFNIVQEPIELPSQKIRVCFIHIGNGCHLEFVESAGEKSPVDNILSKNGNSIYHICYQVNDLEQSLDYLQTHKYIKLRFTRVDNFMKKNFIYMIAPDNQLIELCAPAKLDVKNPISS